MTRKRKPRVWLSDDMCDPELRIEAEELASQRENTMLPGVAAVRRAMRDILAERRRRASRAEAIVGGLQSGIDLSGADLDGSDDE